MKTNSSKRSNQPSATSLTPFLTVCMKDATKNGQPIDVITAISNRFGEIVPVVPAPLMQPANGHTLVNFDTIFYSTVSTQESTFEEADSQVVLRVVPISYHWEFGDGTTMDTTIAGRPLPAKDITHQYKDGGMVQARVTVTFQGEFSLDGGGFTTLDQTVTGQSPTVELTVHTARSELVVPK